jgi:hypothetical protein
MLDREVRSRFANWPMLGLALWAFVLLVAPRADAADGKTLYVESGCNKCHSILAEGIEATGEDDEEAEDDPFADPDEEEAEPGDLSGLGKTWEHDGEGGLQKWLMKRLEIDGEKHKKRFKGSKSDLEALTAWLMTLTEPAPAE